MMPFSIFVYRNLSTGEQLTTFLTPHGISMMKKNRRIKDKFILIGKWRKKSWTCGPLPETLTFKCGLK